MRTNIRWIICGLLFFATTVNYMDRQVLGILKPMLERDMRWSETDFSHMVFAFQLAYALMMPEAGRLIDRVGVRTGYAIAAAIWSVASMSHALARTAFQFMLARFGLGLGESANFPAAIKAVAEWFPEKERALATGILNSGSNVGAMVAPLLVPFVALRLGWQSVFLVTGGLDLVWIAVWLSYFRNPAQHPDVSKTELAYIQSGEPPEPAHRIAYLRLLGTRQAWAFAVGKFMTDPAWWFYLFWIPTFLNRSYHLRIDQLGPPLIAIYIAADVGSILGGGLSTAFMSRGFAETLHAGLRPWRDAGNRYLLDAKPVDRGRADQHGGGGASGMVGQSLYTGVRPVSTQSGGFGGGPRRARGRNERDSVRPVYRPLA